MIFGNAAWGLRETPLEQQLALTRDMKLPLLELSIAGYPRDYLQLTATPAQLRQAKQWFRQYGVRLDCACTGNDFTGDDVEKQLHHVERVLEFCAELEVKYLRIFAGFASDSVVYGARFDRMLAALASAAERARSRGVTLAVETHGGVTPNGSALVHFQSVTTRVDYWPALLETGVKINYDPANLAAAGATDPIAFYRQFAESIVYVHLKDFRTVPGGVTPVGCGEGRLDWTALREALRDYTGPALIEYELPGDVEDGLKRSLAFLRKNTFPENDQRS